MPALRIRTGFEFGQALIVFIADVAFITYVKLMSVAKVVALSDASFQMHKSFRSLCESAHSLPTDDVDVS